MSLSLLKFEIEIDAPVAKVYNTLIDKEGYTKWTRAFNPKSRFEGDWSKDSEMLFIGASKDGGGEGGMVSTIVEHKPYEYISIMHLGVYKNGEKIMSGPEVDPWTGGLENYRFVANGDQTKVEVDMDAFEEYKSYFQTTFPKALILLKKICEKS